MDAQSHLPVSAPALPRQPPAMIRSPRQADRSRLAKDILKQLGKPSGSVPVPDQVPSPGLSANPPLETQASEPPLLEYLDPESVLPPVAPELTTEEEEEERIVADQLLVSKPQSPERNGPPPGAETIEMSDDEGPAMINATANAIVPMEVDEEAVAGDAVSRGSSGLSPSGGDTLVAGKSEKDRGEDSFGGWSSQEPSDHGDTRFTERKSRTAHPFLVAPPLPEEKTLVEGEEEEGLWGIGSVGRILIVP
jgi:hypothetical protein